MSLSDISKVSVQNGRVVNEICGYTDTLPTTVTIELNPDCQVDSGTYGVPTCCFGCISCGSVLITHCANAEEFVQAVQQQMQANYS